MPNNVSYINKTFNEFKDNLKNYLKTYFPNTFNDFSDVSPSMGFVELASYVGDSLSFYQDSQIQENFLLHTRERENLISLAYERGYIPKNSYVSSTDLEMYQLVPSIVSGSVNYPNLTYALIVPENTVVSSKSTGTKFITTSILDFSDTGSAEVLFFNEDYFLIKKITKCISAEIKTTTFNFTSPVKFNSVSLSDKNIIQILNITDSGNNQWYEVPYLAQDTIFENNTNPNYGNDNVPYTLSLKKVPKRFITRFNSNGDLSIKFGAGTSNKSDSQIIPNPDNIQLGLVPSISSLEYNYNKVAPWFAKEYGEVPSNTTLTVKYLVGGGINSNVPSDDITVLETPLDNSNFKYTPSPSGVESIILSSVTINNPLPSLGGRDADTNEEIRMNTLYSYQAQDRVVTKDDYIVRTLSMPSYYGNISKVHVEQDNNNVNLHILSYNTNKKLISSSTTLKQNLKKYINQYRMLTDNIIIKDAYYINLGITFNITVYSGYNGNEILNKCFQVLKEYFNIEKWNINQPILISEVLGEIIKIKGVQSVPKLEFTNKQSDNGTYSLFGYDINAAIRNNIIYPSLDPSIFEIRYPEKDILGAVVSF